jgi:glycosyltransferase involved in cell wall biosynthesis
MLVIAPISLRAGAGGELDMIEFSTQLSARGWQVCVAEYNTLHLGEARQTAEDVERLLGPAEHVVVPAAKWAERILPLPSFRGWQYLTRLIRKADVVLMSQYYGVDLATWVVTRLSRKRIVLSQGNSLYRGKPEVLREVVQEGYLRSVGRAVRVLVDGVRVCNRDDLNSILAEGQPHVVVVHPMSPRALRLANGPAETRATNQSRDRPFRLLFAGRMAHQKGVDLIAQAVTVLIAGDARWESRLLIRIAGSNALGNELASVADHFPSTVQHLGVLSDAGLVRELEAADAVLMPSRYESFGISALEAELVGTPVLGSDVRGLRDAVATARSGFLVPPTVDGIARGIAAMWEKWEKDPRGWEALRESTRAFAIEAFGARARAREFDHFVELLIAEVPSHPA